MGELTTAPTPRVSVGLRPQSPLEGSETLPVFATLFLQSREVAGPEGLRTVFQDIIFLGPGCIYFSDCPGYLIRTASGHNLSDSFFLFRT